MKAAVCYETGKSLVVEDVQLDPPQRGEVLVRVAATAICHSDIHLIRGDWDDWGTPLPLIAGHESAGVVEATGEGVTSVAPGDHVVVSLLRSCGRCFYCMTGAPHLCQGEFALNKASRLRNKRGETIHQGIKTASFAERVVVDQSQTVQVPRDLALDRAALLGCGVITGFGAVVNTARVAAGNSVVVIGAGGVGLNAIQGAALSGAYPIVAVDVRDTKLAAAQSFGATHTANAAQPNAVSELVKQLTSGRKADFCFVTVGSGEAAAQGLSLIRRQGTLVITGIPHAKATLALPVGLHALQERRVIGSFMGSTRLNVDVPRLVQLYQAGRLKLDELVSARYPLDRINDAIESAERGEALRNVIVFEVSRQNE